MNGQIRMGRKLKCYYFDGKTNYEYVKETLLEKEKRIEEFGKWLEGKEPKKEKKIKN